VKLAIWARLAYAFRKAWPEPKMYVFRLTRTESSPDYKAFSALPDARMRFDKALSVMPSGEIESAVLFEVPDQSDARKAVDAVKAGKAVLIDRDRYPEMFKSAEDVINEWLESENRPKDKSGAKNA